jgi:hypothetical protein
MLRSVSEGVGCLTVLAFIVKLLSHAFSVFTSTLLLSIFYVRQRSFATGVLKLERRLP